MRWTVPDPTLNSAAIFKMPLSPFAKAFLMLVSRRSNHPRVQALTREILEAERAAMRRR